MWVTGKYMDDVLSSGTSMNYIINICSGDGCGECRCIRQTSDRSCSSKPSVFLPSRWIFFFITCSEKQFIYFSSIFGFNDRANLVQAEASYQRNFLKWLRATQRGLKILVIFSNADDGEWLEIMQTILVERNMRLKEFFFLHPRIRFCRIYCWL